MADRVFMPRAMDENGDVVSGARAYFYEKGTDTPLTVYYDEAEETAVGSSVVADSAGAFPDIYSTSALRLDIRDPDSVSLPGFPSNGWYVLPTNGVGAASITFSPLEGNQATTVAEAIGNLTDLWDGVTSWFRGFQASASASAARTSLGLGGLATLNIIDEDTMVSDSATRPPSQQSVKAYVDSFPLQQFYESAGNAIPAVETAATKSHGLGNRPTLYQVLIRCQSADQGYAVGDEVDLSDRGLGNGNQVGTWNNATQLGFIYSGSIFVKSRSTTGEQAIDTTKWAIVYRAWR